MRRQYSVCRWHVLPIIAAMCMMCIFTACGVSEAPSSAPSAPAAPTPSASSSDVGGEEQSRALTVAMPDTFDSLHPLYADSVYERSVEKLTQLHAATFDRNGNCVMNAIEGEKIPYNGKDYTYVGASDVSVVYDAERDVTVFTLRLREDLRFSDGVALTADDVLFTYYVLCDPSYVGAYSLHAVPIVGMEAYLSDMAITAAEGIERVNDTEVRLTVKGCCPETVMTIGDVPLLPLHYYGDKALFAPQEGTYGYPRGEVSVVLEKSVSPLGAGPFCWTADGELKANSRYFRGVPAADVLTLTTMTQEQQILAVAQGTVDIACVEGSKVSAEAIAGCNSNQMLNGTAVVTFAAGAGQYTYIGINADKVLVAKKEEQSVLLRRALATIFAVCRTPVQEEYYGESALIVNRPSELLGTESAASAVYATDAEGLPLYSSDQTADQRVQNAVKAAVELLKQAGYEWDEAAAQFIAAPNGASLQYTLALYGAEDSAEALLCSRASALFKNIGIELTVEYREGVANGEDALWCASASFVPLEVMPDYGMAAEALFGIHDQAWLDQLQAAIQSDNAAVRQSAFAVLYDGMLSQAVEVPLFQTVEYTLFCPLRLQAAVLTSDLTPYYDWTDEIFSLGG